MYKCYRNLNNGTISIMVDNLIVGYCQEIILKNCKFSVSEKIRKKVLTENKKYVHAFVIGESIKAIKGFTPYKKRDVIQAGKLPYIFEFQFDMFYKVVYDPYKMANFTRYANDRPIYSSNYCYVNCNGYMQAN
jgi:hypothetical protein